MRLFRFVLLALICCMALQGLPPLVATNHEPLPTHQQSPDQFPTDNSDLPAPLKEFEAKGKASDCDDEAFCLFTLPTATGPYLGAERCERRRAGFDSSKDRLNTLHRLHI